MDYFTTILRSLEPWVVAIAFAVTYIAEHAFPQQKGLADFKHDIRNILFGTLNLAIAVVGGYYLQQLLLFTELTKFGLLHLVSKFHWLQITLGFIMLDVFMYWWHRANHQLHFLWKFHRFHHTDQKLNSTSAVRFHAAEILLSYVARFSLFPLAGITVTIIVLYAVVLFPVIVFHHSNIRISETFDQLLRRVFVTPRMHRIHHSKVAAETNSNYGSVFPYWDRLFHSYISKPSRKVEFGVE